MIVQERINKAVREYLEENGHALTPEQQRVCNLATYDLYYGPLDNYEEDDEDYVFLQSLGLAKHNALNFTAAMNYLQSAFDELPHTLYYEDDSGCVFDREPEGEELETGELDEDGEPIMEWAEPMPYYEIDAKEIRAIVFGKELSTYF